MLRLLKNEPRLVQHTGTCVGVEGNVIKVQTPETTETVEVAHPILIRNLRQGDRVVVLAATRGGVHTLVQLRHLPPDATIVGHFAYLEDVRNDRIRAVLMNGGVLEVLKDSITLPVDLGSGRLMYMEYRVDKVGEYNALRKIEVLYSDDEVIQAALDATYMIETEAITLVSGRSEKLVMPGSAMTVKTHAWNSPVLGHLDSDGHVDAVLVLVHQTDGSGVFFYAVAMYWDAEKCAYVGTNGVFLGDRIDPQNITVDSGVITVDYTERKPDEPMTARPSVGTVKRLVLADGVLRE